MVNTNKLKAKIVEKGYTQEQLAREMGMTRATFARRMANAEEFDVGEIGIMIEVLDISEGELAPIFFNHIVSEMRQ